MELSRYKLDRLGEDTDFALYRGQKPGQARTILVRAPKSRNPNSVIRDRLSRELALAEHLGPGWSARPSRLVRLEDRQVLVLDDPGGQPLASLLGKPLDLRLFLPIAIGIASALRQVHECGLIHKDIKPANVLVEDAGNVWLTGFGFATRLPRERQTPATAAALSGTLSYMAPEQTGRINRSIDNRSDLYALGVTLYEMLVGALPFVAPDPIELIHCHIARPPSPPSIRVAGVPLPIEGLILKLLSKNAEDRYQTAGGVESDLRRCLSELQINRRINQFKLAQHDISPRLRIPERLYGREAEFGFLKGEFDTVANEGKFEFVLVSGSSGVGKSAVVAELQAHVHAAGGLFAIAKFDHYKRDIPYLTLAAAFDELLRPLLGESDAELESWRTSLQEILGSSGQLMVDLMPTLGTILGQQSRPPTLSPQDEKIRFHLIFRRFLSVFARPEHPLVLFLDDLQWLDKATLELVERIAAEEEIPHLLIIGAYRSNEIASSPELTKALEIIQAARGGVKEISLQPLRSEDVGRFVAETLQSDPASVTRLTAHVLKMTHGNPFFTIQFLTTLYTEGLLSIEPRSGAWAWDLKRIRAKRGTDNVGALMAEKLLRFGHPNLQLLKRFSSLGMSARTTNLCKVLGVSQEELDRSFSEFVGAEFLHRLDSAYAFVHDGIRDAAYNLIPKPERPALHLENGRRLLEGVAPQELEEGIFEIVNQFSRCASSALSANEKARLAELYLIAGKRAKISAAYESALTFLAAGCALLSPSSWDQHYQTAFELELHQADCKFMVGEIAFSEERLAILSKRSAVNSDLALVVGRQMILYTYLGRTEQAATLGIDCLAKLGVAFPLRATPALVEQEYLALIEKIGNRSVDTLIDLPAMTDVHWREVMVVLEELLSPAALLDADLLNLVLLRMCNISLDYGNTDESVHAYSNIGARVLGWCVGSFELGREFGDLALRLIEERGFDRYASRVYAIISGTVAPWNLPLRQSYDIALRAIEMPRERGGIGYQGFAWACGLTALLDSGKPLEDVNRLAEKGLFIARKAGFTIIIEFMTTYLWLIRALRGLTPDFNVFGSGEVGVEDRQSRLESTTSLVHAMTRNEVRKLQLMFHAGNYEACLEILEKIGGNFGESPILCKSPVFEVAEYCFYSALARAAYLNAVPRERWEPHFQAIHISYGHLSEWATRCPANFSDRACLVSAEIARLEGRELEAQHLYEKAIVFAREYDFIQNEALANELAGRFYDSRRLSVIAEAYMGNARSCYSRWGADGKVRQIDQRYPHLANHRSQRMPQTTVQMARSQDLDVTAVVEMYQALSREIVLDRLIERLMITVVEHAGAMRGLLLLRQEGDMRVVAHAVTSHELVSVDLSHRPDVEGELPLSVLRHVMRTHDAVIIDDALEANTYWTDPYLRGTRPRSVLCLPLIKQSRLVGVLYLENDVSPHVFTQHRVSVLKLLASQAAISIENAELFLDLQNTQEQARRAGDELRRSFDMIPALAWRASPDGTFEFANKQWHDYTGISYKDARGGTWMRSFHPDDIENAADEWRRLVEFGISGEFETRMQRFDGEYRSFLIRVTPMHDEKGNVVKWHGTNTDIENLKRAEQAQEALARVSRVTAMGELTVSIAHEVNQPLMAIVTNAASCLRWLGDDQRNLMEARLAAERIIRHGHRAGDIIASIRALAKKSSPEAAELDLNEVIVEVLKLTRNELDRHAISVEMELMQEVRLALGDRVQMQQVLLNLILNGIEAINASGYPLRVLKLRTEVGGPGYIVVSISDTGIGLDPNSHEQIFEMFFTTKPDGIGIGLSICRSIVEGHGGRLWASPNSPRGTTFQFTIPIFVAESRIGPVA